MHPNFSNKSNLSDLDKVGSLSVNPFIPGNFSSCTLHKLPTNGYVSIFTW